MEPRRDDGDDHAALPAMAMSHVLPQWSPVVTTGTTPGRHSDAAAGLGAAMEPRRDDGDDRYTYEWRTTAGVAAMEPRRDDGDDQVTRALRGSARPGRNGAVVTTGTTRLIERRLCALVGAAMEPRRDDGDDVPAVETQVLAPLPQWSPVVTTGTTRPPRRPLR